MVLRLRKKGKFARNFNLDQPQVEEVVPGDGDNDENEGKPVREPIIGTCDQYQECLDLRQFYVGYTLAKSKNQIDSFESENKKFDDMDHCACSWEKEEQTFAEDMMHVDSCLTLFQKGMYYISKQYDEDGNVNEPLYTEAWANMTGLITNQCADQFVAQGNTTCMRTVNLEWAPLKIFYEEAAPEDHDQFERASAALEKVVSDETQAVIFTACQSSCYEDFKIRAFGDQINPDSENPDDLNVVGPDGEGNENEGATVEVDDEEELVQPA